MIDARRTIVITAIGVVSPYGTGLDCLQAGMLAGKCCLAPSRDLYPGFEGTTAQVEGALPVRDWSGYRLSRTDRLAVLAARNAVREPDRDGDAFCESGVVMASTVAGLTEIDPEVTRNPTVWYKGDGLGRAATYPAAHVADAVADYLGARGPRFTVSVACASGAIAIILAANLLLDGAAPMMLAGGSDALCPFTLSGFSSLQALDTDPCRPFDQNRKGLNIGEGAAVLVLETFERALERKADVLAVLRGWAMSNDAFHSTAPQEQGSGLVACMAAAMEMAGVRSDAIGYVNAHGTGTPLNDAAEAKAYESVFRGCRRAVPVSSTKSYFGHCLGAAGALEAVVTIIAVRCGALFPTLRLTDPIDCLAVDWLRGEVQLQDLPLALTVSAGFGGSNAALIFGMNPS